MPHAVDQNSNEESAPVASRDQTQRDAQEEQDDALIAQFLSGGDATDLNPLSNLVFAEGETEKADDAIDYEDISDGELDDMEEFTTPQNGGPAATASHTDTDLNGILNSDVNGDVNADDHDDLDDLFNDTGADAMNADVSATADLTGPNLAGDEFAGDGLDDLFGDGLFSDPVDAKPLDQDLGISQPSGSLTLPASLFKKDPKDTVPISGIPEKSPAPQVDGVSPDESEEYLEQMRLFGRHRERMEQGIQGVIDSIWEAPQTDQELFERIWPTFKKDEVPKFGQLLPHPRAFYNGKKPLKVPKPLQPHKIHLDIELDQERLFKSNIQPNKRKRTTHMDSVLVDGMVWIGEEQQEKVEEEIFTTEDIDDNEVIGGVSMLDLRMLVEPWDILEPQTPEHQPEPTDSFLVIDGETQVEDQPPLKKMRLSDGSDHSLPMFMDDFGSFDDPEALTAKIAKKVILDLNDPYLLLDTNPPPPKAREQHIGLETAIDGTSLGAKKLLERRFNFSNDDAYHQLQENLSKIRGSLSNMSVAHSHVAKSLLYPFYKVKLSIKEARAFHRPTMPFPVNQSQVFKPCKRILKKQQKDLTVDSHFKKSEDLSMGDNSTMLLVEYSEEYPTMLSNFGMGSKFIHYWRRTDENAKRPHVDVGEAQVLLPEDKSPFELFGNIEPGQVCPTFHNAMYRAPVFKHDAKATDFLCIRSHTGVDGSSWYLREIANLHVAGQQFPSMEVPGTHSRKVTDAAKRRLRMISWRIYNRNKLKGARQPWLSNEMIRAHLPGSDIAQNRGKMREFMAYDKTNGSWTVKPGDVVPTDDSMRDWIKPEDICLLDSMQVGDRHLQDVGYNRDDGDGEGEEEGEKESEGIDQQLAPWNTTKNFINACAGKAMLQLHGEGDPSGRGEAFSLIKTSMKGGFRAIGESVEDRLDAERLKEYNGHSYNVAKQQQAYEEAIKRIWEAQKASLSNEHEPDDIEPGVEDEEVEPDRHARLLTGRTPRSEVGTPSLLYSRRDDETGSQFSRVSSSTRAGHVLKIKRVTLGKNGKKETVEEIIHDPRIVRMYLKKRQAKEIATKELADFVPTGNAEEDAKAKKHLLKTLERLENNKKRRKDREKAKKLASGGDSVPGTPHSPSETSTKYTGSTQRKCANCGQVGHIKTNKKCGNPFCISNSAFGFASSSQASRALPSTEW